MLVFGERGKLEYPEKNLLQQGREPTTNSTHMPAPGFESGPHWWEASVLTTALHLAPINIIPMALCYFQHKNTYCSQVCEQIVLYDDNSNSKCFL